MSLVNHINNNNLEEVKNQNDIINEIYNNLENKSLGNLDLSILTVTKEDITSDKTLFINGILENGTHQCIDLSKDKIISFLNRTNLTLTSLPSSLTNIGKYVFYNYSSLKLTELPFSITNIDNNAFHGCRNLALTSLPSNIINISDSAFYYCTSLALTELPSSITNIGNQAF